MTWIGKILSVLVMVVALAGMWFTVSAYVARTNWKAQADTYKVAYEQAKAAVESEHRLHQSEKDALRRDYDAEVTKSGALATRLTTAETANKATVAQVGELSESLTKFDIDAKKAQANLQAALDEVGKARARTAALEDEKVLLTIAREVALKDKQAAENQAKQSNAEKVLADRRVEDLTAQLTDARATAGGTNGSLLNSAKPPAAVPEGFRATVTAAADGYVVVSLGIDAGLTVGATVDIFRDGEGARYLGTVVIDRVYPKQAVGVFRPADPKRTFKQLRPEEQPKVGDTVGRVGNVSAQR